MSAIFRALRPRVRLLACAAFGVVAFLLIPHVWDRTSRFLAAWDGAALLYFLLAWRMMARSTVQSTKERAREEDEGAIVILVITVVAAIASLAAIGLELSDLQSAGARDRMLRLSLAGLTILCSWGFVHTVFAIHYAHEYYGDHGEVGGLEFPREPEPDYWDFMYFAFSIGAASQTSDISIASRSMRRLVLGHSILSFLFNTVILALVINVGAGLI